MTDALTVIGQHRLVPVIAIDSVDDAKPLGEALLAGGLPIAEITFRTAAAAESIKIMSQLPNMLVGAGTVLDVDTVKRAMDSGAKFIVSPGFSSKVVSYCVSNKIPVTPGTLTPSEIQMALEHGLTTVKFFPAESFGGIKTIKAMTATFPQVKFMPTGGIIEKILPDYLAVKAILAVGGSWFVTKDLINAKQFDQIAQLTRQAMTVVKGG